MVNVNAVQILFVLFGNKPFRIGNIREENVVDLAEVLGITVPTSIGKRTKIGKWLTCINNCVFELTDGTKVRVVMLERGVADNIGRYQLERAG